MPKVEFKPIAIRVVVAGLVLSGCGGKQVPVAIPGDRYGGGGNLSSPIHNLPTGTIAGRVVDARTGLGISDVRIDVQGASPPISTRTDGSGNYLLPNVAAMRLKLLLEKQGYSYLQSNGDVIVQVLPGVTVSAPDIKLSAQLDAVPNAFVFSIGNLDRPRAIALEAGSKEEFERPQALYAVNRENYQLFGNIQTPLRVWGLRKFNLAGGLENKFGAALLGQELHNPTGVSVDRGGNVYVTDPGSNAIVAFSSFGSYIKPPANDQSFQGVSKPYDIQVMRTGWYAVASAGNNQVMFFDAGKAPAKDTKGIAIKPLVGSSGLKGLTVDADDNIYTIDDAARAGGVIRRMSIGGQLQLQFGFRGGRGASYFEGPTDLAVDNRNGDIYVVDSGNNRIQRFNRDGQFMSEFGGMGSGNGQFNSPTGIAVDRDGYVYVSDTNNNRIQKFAPSRLYQPGT